MKIQKGTATLYLIVMAAALIPAIVCGSVFSAGEVTTVCVAPLTGGILAMLAIERLCAIVGLRFSASLAPAILGLLTGICLSAVIY